MSTTPAHLGKGGYAVPSFVEPEFIEIRHRTADFVTQAVPLDGAGPMPRCFGLTCPVCSDRIGAKCHCSSAL